MNKYSRYFVLLVGLYFFTTLIIGINMGQFHMLKSDTVISLSTEPEKFWGVAFIQLILFLLCLIVFFPKLSKAAFVYNKKQKYMFGPLDRAISEIEACIAYGEHEKANDLVQALLIQNPGNGKLLALRKRISNN